MEFPAKEFFKTIPELNAYYGVNATGFVKVNMKSGTEKPVKFDMEKGAIIGTGATTTVELLVSNSTNTNQSALIFSSNIVLESPTYMTKFMFYPSVSKINVANTRLTHNAIGMNTTLLNDKFQEIMQASSLDFNSEYKSGWSIANLDPQLAMLGGLL